MRECWVRRCSVEVDRAIQTDKMVSCVPKKVTWIAAAIAETIHDAAAYGFSIKEIAPFDWTTFKHKRDAYVKRLNDIYAKNLDNDKVEHLHGRAHMLSKNEVEVAYDNGTKETIRAKKILIATGGHPKVAIVGAGYIAVEMSGMFHHLGSEAHLFIRHDKVLRTFDPMIQDKVTEEYKRQGIHIHTNSSQSKIEKVPGKEGWMTLHYEDSNGPGTLEIDCLLWAIGRAPELEDLGLDKAGVKQNSSGHVIVDDYQNTNVDNIYALGDVCGKAELTPVAIAAGRHLANRLFGGAKFSTARLEYNNIPSVVFAHPEVGSIGMTEPQAREAFGDSQIKIYNSSFTAMYYAMIDPAEKQPSSYKIICAGDEERVVGLHIMGLGSAEMLQGFGVAVKMGARKRDLDSCVAIHPTSAEELVTMT
jgi:glutathione reductase (NADPH)